MKKLLFLFSLILSSCSCLIGQIPPQYLHVDSTCGAALPDLRPMLIWEDNCGIDTVEQTPTPGSWLTQKYNTILIRAIDNFGNYTDVLTSVELIDTIPPKLVRVDSTLLISAYDHLNTLYDTAERLLARQVWYEESVAPDSIVNLGGGDFMNDYLVCYTAPGKAWGLEGARVWTFAKPGTSIIFPE